MHIFKSLKQLFSILLTKNIEMGTGISEYDDDADEEQEREVEQERVRGRSIKSTRSTISKILDLKIKWAPAFPHKYTEWSEKWDLNSIRLIWW